MPSLKKALTWTLAAGVFVLCAGFIALLLPFLSRTSYTVSGPDLSLTEESFLGATTASVVETVHLPTPESVKAIYMTACVAATPSLRENLMALVDTTELNAVVLDIKDSTGVISFVDESLQPSASITRGCKVGDMREFIEDLHDIGIYVIGRISVFQDPYYTALRPDLAVKSVSSGGVWRDHKGLSFVDVGAEEYWDYIIRISDASYDLGFDELNFDYIRYPSDGNMQDVSYTWTTTSTVMAASTTDSTPSTSSGQASSPQATSTTSSQVRAATKPEMLESFFKHLSNELQSPSSGSGQAPVLSADLFGMVTTVESDMGIGQVLERALPYFDYIAPMVYPSHYPRGWNGFANPAEHPYDVIDISMSSALEREQDWLLSQGMATSTPSKMRPWLQDFDLGTAYGPDKIRAQIQATYDTGLTSWMLWNAANRYTSSALLPEEALVEL